MGLEAISASTISIVFVGTLVPIIFLIDQASSHSPIFVISGCWLTIVKIKLINIFHEACRKTNAIW